MGKKIEVVIPQGKLWPNTPSGAPVAIEVCGATGEYKSGKTILGLSIAPGVHPEGHAFSGQPRTLYLDFEKSGGTYGGFGCQRIDVPAKLFEKFGGTYKPIDAARWFIDLIERMPVGRFDVVMADPITDVESGIVDIVRSNPEAHGYTKGQFDKSVPLLMGAVKAYWKQVLLKLSNVCQCFFFTSHLRDEFRGSTPTGNREPRGKETLFELASLYLWLERKPEADGTLYDAPSAIVLKDRLADTRLDPATGLVEITPLLPPRIPTATVQEIWRYIASPPDYRKLKDKERVIEKAPTEMEILTKRQSIAQAEQATEETRLERMKRQAEIQAAANRAAGQQPQQPDTTAKTQADAEAKRKAEAARAAEQAEIDQLKAEAEAKIAALKAEEAKLLAGHSSTTAATTAPQGTNGRATPAQVAEARDLAGRLNLSRELLATMLADAAAKLKYPISKVSDLKAEHAAILLEKLRAKLERAAIENEHSLPANVLVDGIPY